jgi:hypothetical protein
MRDSAFHGIRNQLHLAVTPGIRGPVSGETDAHVVKHEMMVIGPGAGQVESGWVTVEVTLGAAGIAVIRDEVAVPASIEPFPIPPMQVVEV